MAGKQSAAEQTGRMRLDKWLWHTRFFKTRGLAARLCQGGKVRVNGTITNKAHSQISIGDTLTFAQGHHIRVIKVLDLPPRRGPAPEAQACYEDLDPPAEETRLPKDRISAKMPKEVATPNPQGRPSAKDRRALQKLRGKD
ncbi:MAG: RNA-binding S4 domain-containing protein [Pseudomonadota bacterium]